MKKELFAAALLLALLILSAVNTAVIDGLCSDIESVVRDAGSAAGSGDWARAQNDVQRALELWRSNDGYLKIVLRHTDIETLVDDFYELTEHIYTQDPGATKSAVELVGEHLKDIAEMESINFGSIF